LNQADYFSNLILQENWLLPPVADIENNGGLSPAAYADAVKLFLDRVESLTTIKPIIYTSRSKWAQVEPRVYWPTYDLWAAHYTANLEPLIPEGWLTWQFWQYTSSGDGPTYGAERAAIDLNWFNGDLDDLHEYIGVPTMPKVVKVNKHRNAVIQDDTYGKYIEIAEDGQLFHVVDVKKDDYGEDWYKVAREHGWLPAKVLEVVE
jgi:GH25 family lysozyme M1 (1,4-beta-N-acetylmuramidase)